MLALSLRRRLVVPLVALLAGAGGLVIRLSDADRPRPPAAVSPTSAVPQPAPSPSPSGRGPAAEPAPPGSAPQEGPGAERPRAGAPRASGTGGSRPDAGGGPVGANGAEDASLDEMLGRDRPPPDGVAAQLDFFVGGGPECPPGQSPAPDAMQVTAPEMVLIPSAPRICLFGFASELPVTLEVTAPTGATRTVEVPARWDSTTEPLIAFPPGSPEGKYTIVGRQGKGFDATTLVAARTDHPTMALHPLRAAVGSTVDVYIGGLAPGRRTDLHLYACGDARASYTYQATHTVTANAAGEAHLTLRTSASTPPGCYMVGSLEIIDPKTRPDGGLPTYLDFRLFDPATEE